MEQEFPPLAQRTLKENVTNILRQSIVDGSLAPGSELNQAQIAEKLGVSRGPIREALGKLEQEGLIRTVPYKGVFITPLDRQYVEELYSVRALLETMALERGIERMTDDDLSILRRYVDEMRLAAQAENTKLLLSVDLQFHEHIVRMAQHDIALRLWKQLEVGVQRCVYTQHRIYEMLEEVVGSHPILVEAIAARNVESAVEILHKHISESADHIVHNWPTSLDSPMEEDLSD